GFFLCLDLGFGLGLGFGLDMGLGLCLRFGLRLTHLFLRLWRRCLLRRSGRILGPDLARCLRERLRRCGDKKCKKGGNQGSREAHGIYSQKNSITSVEVARVWPKAIHPCPRRVNSSRRRTISLSPSMVMKVPFALWSVRMNLSRRRSILPCAREAIRSRITRSADWSRPSASDGFSDERITSPACVLIRSFAFFGL